jgi:hypothetical protein
MTRRKCSVVLSITIVACSLISYLVVRGLGDGNGNVDEIVEHLSTPLVLWGWNPGNGGTPIPTPQAQFLAKVKEWAAKEAACPGLSPSR